VGGQVASAIGRVPARKRNAGVQPTLEELVHIQLEFAWKSFAAGTSPRPASVESLLEQFPAVLDENVLAGVLRQKFHSRQQAGDQPSAASYPDLDLDHLPTPNTTPPCPSS